MEYLMTYGWAILIVIIVVAALFAMGVFSPTSTTVACSPCFSNFAFQDYADGTLVINNGPQAITLTAVQNGTMPAQTSYAAGERITITGISTSGDVGVVITYTVTSSGLSHNASATIHNP